MTPKELLYSILNDAFTGKLVKTSDILVSNLFETRSKNSWLDNKKNRKYLKDSQPLFSNIPEKWLNVKIGYLVNYLGSGKNYKYETFDNGLYCFGQKNNQEYGINLDGIKFVSKADWANAEKENYLQKDDVLINSLGTGTMGRSGIWKCQLEKSLFDSCVIVLRTTDLLYPDYLYYFLRLNRRNLEELATGSTNQKSINKSEIANLQIPLATIEEQKRIVAKIEELLPLVNKYEEAWTKLEKFNNQFPIDMERSILQYAMQGKLVKSAPSEGTGQELLTSILKTIDKKKINKYEKINIENCPFKIPSNWEWVRLGIIFNHSAGKALNSSDREGKEYQYITTSNVYWNSFDLTKTKTMFYKQSELERCSAKKGDLLVLEGGDVGRAAIWNYDFDIRIQNHIHCIRNVNHLNIKFFYFLFFLYKSMGFINGKGIGIQGLSANVLDNLVLPLPPLEEQNRIVNRIEELLPLCRGLNE